VRLVEQLAYDVSESNLRLLMEAREDPCVGGPHRFFVQRDPRVRLLRARTPLTFRCCHDHCQSSC
jgi:hypothetical protein